MAHYHPVSTEAYGDLEAGFSGHSSSSPLKPATSPRRPGRMFCDPCDDADELLHGHHHYLDICFRCRKLLSGNRDIFMYRGDMPFCSEECRQEQIEIDEAREQRLKQTGRAEQQRQRQRQQKQSPQRIPIWAW